MSMNAINSENILQNYGGNNVNSLNHILEFDVDDEHCISCKNHNILMMRLY